MRTTLKHCSRLVFAVTLLAVAMPASAQLGCVNSPENPTAILALVGSAGAAVAMLRTRLRK